METGVKVNTSSESGKSWKLQGIGNVIIKKKIRFRSTRDDLPIFLSFIHLIRCNSVFTDDRDWEITD